MFAWYDTVVLGYGEKVFVAAFDLHTIYSIGYSDAWVCREPLTELTMYFTVYLFLSHSMTAGLQKQYVFSSIILCVYIFCVLFCVSYF